MQLTANNVTAGYGATDVLRSVSLCLEAGEFVGLLGQNGCGKSTLLRVLSHSLPCRSGSVTLEGRGIGAWSALERARRIAFVPQSEPTHFEFAVRDVVLMGRYPHRPRGGLTTEDFDLAALVMEETDILHLAERSITELSGGEHRRVLLARALIQDAPLLLLDEPTAHLDIAHQAELMEQVRRRVREGRGALAALHDLNQAAEFCDRLVLMQQGKLLADGAPEEVLTRENLRIAYQVEAEIGVNPATGRPMTLYVTPIRRS